ncbi:hypothetical protein ET445_02725 [Agromyces protaetiae]|uniref:Uncharacterized protein n=1 Tax=Agromyces protaetiae TaxID=2509455 RepID=A0A4P6F9G9_9MICO|nr:hypothetical protein [Agromyces protaetiae]QAY72414.1 hypothetical protein ET445_02725 [Agromyces protaetiae]
MPHSDADRISHLQRIAYGAGSDDAARAEAAAELAAIFSPRTAPTAVGTLERPGGADIAGDSRGLDAGGEAFTFDALVSAVEGREEPDAASARAADDDREADGPGGPAGLVGFLVRHRAAVLSAAAALAVGLAVGWSLGTSEHPTGGRPLDAAGIASGSSTGRVEPPRPVAGTSMIRVFDRPQDPAFDVPAALADSAAGSLGALDLDPSSTRLLAERDDGLAAFAARHANGLDVCLLVGVGSGLASTCTNDGQVDAGGLSIVGTFEQPYGQVGVIWEPDGDLSWAVG